MFLFAVTVPIVTRYRDDASKLARPGSAQPSAKIATIEIRQTYVDKYRVVAIFRREFKRPVSIVCDICDMPGGAGKRAESVAKTNVIFNEKHAHDGFFPKRK